MNEQHQQDQQTYTRASSAALLGLATQLVFAVIVAGLGLYTRSTTFYAAAWYLFGGVPIWATLWLLYNQHRQERVEALEAEQLSREDARAAALFDEAGHELATARKRLDSFYKWGLNVVSIVVGIYLLAAGLALFFGNLGRIEMTDDGRDFRGLIEAALANAAANPWMLVGFTALLAFLGFLVARYIAGMTRVTAWQLLRGGAAYLIGNVLVLVLLLIASGFVAAGNVGILAALSLIIPLLMALLGLETLLAFVFGIYRPRRKDDVVRPAFDSRLLGWLTSPESVGKIVSETLNYQFGFEITKSWFYVLLGRALAPLILAGVVLVLALSCLVIVAPNEQAVVTSRGAFVRIADPGVSFKLPWPLGQAEKFDVRESKQMVIGGYDVRNRIQGAATLWTNEHVAGEVIYFPTAPTRIEDAVLREQVEEELEGSELPEDAAPVRTSSPLGGLIAMQAVVTYHIGDLETYISPDSAGRPEQMLSAIAQSELNSAIASREVDELLGVGRLDAAAEILTRLRQRIQPYGIEVQDVLLYDVHPPNESEVAEAFLQQVNAIQSQKTDVENAQRDAIGILSAAAGSRAEANRIAEAIARLNQLRDQKESVDGQIPADLEQQITDQQAEVNRLIDRAGGEAARTLADARQERWQTSLYEKSQSSRFTYELAAFNLAPDYFKSRYYLDTIAEAFENANRRVITTVPLKSDSTIRLNLEDAGSAATLFSDQ